MMTQSKFSRALFANWSTIISTACATLAMSAVVLVTELHPAWAQQAVIATKADGPGAPEGGHMFVMPAIPNRFVALTRPDFGRRDMPILNEKLALDESQRYVVEVLLDGYTDQFKDAVEEFRSVQRRFRFQIPGFEGEIFGGPLFGDEEGGSFFHMSDGDDADVHILDFGDDMTFVMESPGAVEIGVTRSVNIDTDVNVDANGGGEPQVSVAFVASDENGESLLTEEQIKEITERISERIKERMAEVEAKRAELQARREAAAAARAADPNAPVHEDEPATAEEVAKAGHKLIAERNRLRDEFANDVKLVLNDEQKERWPGFERLHRRVSTMRFAEFNGERVDLIEVLKDQEAKAADEAALAAATKQYELELDEALKARNELLPEHEIEMLLMMDEMIKSQSMDNEERLDLMDRVGDARARVRDANLDHAERIAPFLADDSRQAFLDAVKQRAYPHIYHKNSTQRSLEAALAFEDLDEQSRTAIRAIDSEYQSQVAALNDRIASEIRKGEPRQHREMFESIEKIRQLEMRREAGENVDIPEFLSSPQEKLMGERQQLNKKTMDQLRGMLTEEQKERLPKMRRSMFIGGPDAPPVPMPPPPPGAGVRVIKTESAPD